MRRLLAVLTSVSLIISTTGCASASGTRVAVAPQAGAADKSTMADYVQRLQVGSKVRVERTDGTSLRGTLMKASAESIVVQKNTRVPEPPLEVPVAQIARVTLEGNGASTGKAIGIGIASGVGTFFAILAILAAAWD